MLYNCYQPQSRKRETNPEEFNDRLTCDVALDLTLLLLNFDIAWHLLCRTRRGWFLDDAVDDGRYNPFNSSSRAPDFMAYLTTKTSVAKFTRHSSAINRVLSVKYVRQKWIKKKLSGSCLRKTKKKVHRLRSRSALSKPTNDDRSRVCAVGKKIGKDCIIAVELLQMLLLSSRWLAVLLIPGLWQFHLFWFYLFLHRAILMPKYCLRWLSVKHLWALGGREVGDSILFVGLLGYSVANNCFM